MSIWVRPIILAMEEAEFGMNMVGGCSRQIVQVTLSWKYPAQNKTGGMAQDIGYLISKDKAPSSNTSTTKMKKRRDKQVSVGKVLQPNFSLGLIYPVVQQIVLTSPRFHIVSHACVVSHWDMFQKEKMVNL
jgi:hypothetical protein